MTFDLTPYYKSTVGFDRLASLLDSVGSLETNTNSYPPYNIERLDDNTYRITMAVAGFGEADLDIEVKENTLTIKGEKSAEAQETEYLHRGIAARGFERRFQLADYVEVTGAQLENGLLHLELTREIPEILKPRKIAFTKNDKSGKKIDQKAA
jgi:molecular chaperone IbpA